ncbi:MAG: beta-propeller domain-containing protein [Methanoregula sp.]|jgi:uncharacterized secreted protein with C-terminal beta-propeller domain
MITKTTALVLAAGIALGILACFAAVTLAGSGSDTKSPSLLSTVSGGIAGNEMGNIPEFSSEEQAQRFLISHTDAWIGTTGTGSAQTPQKTVRVSVSPGGVRTWSFAVDASTFKPDEYLVMATAVHEDVTATSLFNVLVASPGQRSSGSGSSGTYRTSPDTGNGYFIAIDPVGDRYIGDRFTITGTTNLPADEEILVEVYSSSFSPTQKSQSGEFSGATGTVKASSSSPIAVPVVTAVPTSAPSQGDEPRYSTTNVQVHGVDEADIVKTNGTFIYAVTGNTLRIIDAYPADHAKMSSTLKFSGNPESLYLYGDRLVVITEESSTRAYWQCEKIRCMDASWSRPKTTILVYDVTDPSRPQLVRQVVIDGSLSDSRMIDSYLYFVTSSPADSSTPGSSFPQILDYAKGTLTPDVYYFDTSDDDFSYSTIGAFDVTGKSSVRAKSFLIGSAGTVYVSPTHLYIGIASPVDDSGAMQTQVYSFTIDQGRIAYAADGAVSGELLSQYSLDEYNGSLRLATTGIEGAGKYKDSFSSVYVLDADMQTVGSIRKLAAGDHITAARFIGSRLYLATSDKADPLLVIDLSDPKNMSVLGSLKLPGYASYLHPYDDNYMISVGREVNNGGVRIALVNVTDVSSPTVTDTIELGSRGSDSEVLYDPKAFLFDKENNLLVLPVHLVGQSGTVAYRKYQPPEEAGIWGGAYVFTVAPAQGFHVKGTVEHYDGTSGTVSPVKRSLYIDSTLYTISSDMVAMSDLNNSLALVNSLEL